MKLSMNSKLQKHEFEISQKKVNAHKNNNNIQCISVASSVYIVIRMQ